MQFKCFGFWVGVFFSDLSCNQLEGSDFYIKIPITGVAQPLNTHCMLWCTS